MTGESLTPATGGIGDTRVTRHSPCSLAADVTGGGDPLRLFLPAGHLPALTRAPGTVCSKMLVDRRKEISQGRNRETRRPLLMAVLDYGSGFWPLSPEPSSRFGYGVLGSGT